MSGPTKTRPQAAQSGSGSGLPSTITAVKTSGYTAAAGEFVRCDATAGGFQVTLPAGTVGDLVTVKKVDGGGNAVAVDVTAGGTIDGDAGGASITSPQFGAIFECISAGVWMITAPTSSGGSNGTDGADGADGATGATGAAGADGQTTVTANAQTANYTLVLGDAGKSIDVTAATGKTLTVPPNSSVAFPLGTVVEGAQLGAGAITWTAGAGVTLSSAGGLLATRAQYSVSSARKIATNTWLVSGDLA